MPLKRSYNRRVVYAIQTADSRGDQFTTSVMALDALLRAAADPPYTALTLYLPAGNAVWKFAVPV